MVSRCILVIDDDLHVSRLIQVSLDVAGAMATRHAASSREGLQGAIQQRRIHPRIARVSVAATSGSSRRVPPCAGMIAASDAFRPQRSILIASRPFVGSLLFPAQEVL